MRSPAIATQPRQVNSTLRSDQSSSSVCTLECTLSIPVGFHLLAPSKEQHTGDVIAELTAGEEVGEAGAKISEREACAEHCVLRLEWLLSYCISVQAVIVQRCMCITLQLYLKRRFKCLVVNP